MDWLVFVFFNATFTALMDFFTKLSSGKIHEGLGGILVNTFAVIPVLLFTLFSKLAGEGINSSKMGIIYSSLAGLAIGVGTVFMFKMYSAGANLSLAVPLMRVILIIIATLLGIFVLKEGFSLKFFLGLALALIGIYLLATSKV